MSEATDRWLGFAREDLQMADLALSSEIYNQACFHAQQCAEKSLKAMIVFQGVVTPRLHAITDLANLLPEAWLSDLREEIGSLDDYYIPTRYPDALPGSLPEGLPGKADAESAVALARRLLEKAKELLAGAEKPDANDTQ